MHAIVDNPDCHAYGRLRTEIVGGHGEPVRRFEEGCHGGANAFDHDKLQECIKPWFRNPHASHGRQGSAIAINDLPLHCFGSR